VTTDPGVRSCGAATLPQQSVIIRKPAEFLCAGANGAKQFRAIALDADNIGNADALITS